MARTVRTVRKSKEEVHYPRHVKELCQIMEEAKEQGQLRAVMEEEFKKPVSMTGIWECRSYFHMEDEKVMRVTQSCFPSERYWQQWKES